MVFDLIDKIRELSASGDGNATKIDAQYEKYIGQLEAGNDQGLKGALEFERVILETSKDQLQLLDQHQYGDLQRLREDRHRCAHPSFQRVGEPYRPSAEQARLHLRNAVVHVLAEPPVQGKAAMAKLRELVLSQYFPRDRTKAIVQLKASPLNKPADALVNGFVDMLVFGYVTTTDALYGKLAAMVALAAALQMFPEKAEQRFRQQVNKAVRDVPDASFSYAAAVLVHVESAWSLLEADCRDKVESYIANAAATDVIRGLGRLSKIPALTPATQRRVVTLTFDELVKAIGDYELGSLAKDSAIKFLGESHSFNRVNDVMTQAIFPLFEHLTVEDFKRIIQLPTETGADMPGARGYSTFIQKLRETNAIPEVELNALLIANKADYLVPQLEAEA
ncbi:hypothetical protein MAFF301524_24200 [Ralstonia pseudosolanacearum]|nr:hypothetical protein MAFF301524_24200 [Ralstonia pseudosolanacearum]